jgi:hypothetical protein
MDEELLLIELGINPEWIEIDEANELGRLESDIKT